MDASRRPCRSVLYIPGANQRALEKARGLAADAIIFDLEDAVAADQKENARETLRQELEKGGYGKRMLLVRPNGLDTVWGRDDIAAFADANIDGILLPKVDGAKGLNAAAELCPGKPLWAMMETARAVLNAEEIAEHALVQGLVLGTNDLAKELGAQVQSGRAELHYVLQKCLLAARAAQINCVDGVYNAFKDETGLMDECRQAKFMGYDGKTLIHPAQIDTANRLFAPSNGEVDLATRQIAAFEEAQRAGKGVAVVDGRLVENLHIETAKATLAKAERIAELEAAL